jgi:predicted nucleic acid-binding protein
LILVDSSIWIDFFSSAPSRAGAELRRMIEESEPFALTGLVVAEVLQGLTRDPARIEAFLAQWDLLEPRGIATYREAAKIFREARSKGFSLTTIDTMIAVIAMEHNASVFTLDRDFGGIARLAPLQLYSF